METCVASNTRSKCECQVCAIKKELSKLNQLIICPNKAKIEKVDKPKRKKAKMETTTSETEKTSEETTTLT
jgi:hypothetical protein